MEGVVQLWKSNFKGGCVRVEDIFKDDDGDEIFYMSYFFSYGQLRADGVRSPPKLAKHELVESVNVYPAALGGIV